jgi:hypothetical protein
MLTAWRPRITALLVLVTCAATSAGCTASSTATRLPVAPSPAASFSWASTSLHGAGRALTGAQPLGVAADGTSFAFAALAPSGPPLQGGECSCTEPVVYASSGDGAKWRRARIPGLTALAQQPVAGYAGLFYLLGVTSDGPRPALAVWTSTDALHWSIGYILPVPPVLQPDAFRGEVPGAGIAAGSGGAEAFVDETGGPFVGFLHAAAGGRFTLTVTETVPEDPGASELSADGSGYVFMTTTEDNTHGVEESEVYTSADGTTWTDETSALPVNTANWGTSAGAGNAGTLVVAGWTTSFANGLSEVTEIWTQRSQPDGAWKGSNDLDPGRLPQPGVGPIGSQVVNDLVPLGPGFLATGSGTSDAAAASPVDYAAVWYSPDGRTWIKQPETTAGFEHASAMWGAAVNHGRIVLIGYTTNDAGVERSLRMWHGTFTP